MQVLSMQTDQSVEVMKAEVDRLQNSCNHLQRSNIDLQEAISEGGPDADFQQAIEVFTASNIPSPVEVHQDTAKRKHQCQAQENIVVLARQQGKIARLRQEIQEAESLHQQQPEPPMKAAQKQQLSVMPAMHADQMQLSHLQTHNNVSQAALLNQGPQVQQQRHHGAQTTPQLQAHQPAPDVVMTDSHNEPQCDSNQDSMWL